MSSVEDLLGGDILQVYVPIRSTLTIDQNGERWYEEVAEGDMVVSKFTNRFGPDFYRVVVEVGGVVQRDYHGDVGSDAYRAYANSVVQFDNALEKARYAWDLGKC